MQPRFKMESRGSSRSHCRIDSKVRYFDQQADARVMNVSRTGIALELFGRLHAATGSKITVENEDMGLIEGIVRWCRSGRLGIHIRQNSNSHAQVVSYFRHFHKDVRPFGKR